MNSAERTTAAAYPNYLENEVLADSEMLQWPGLYVRRYRCPRLADRFFAPATPEPLISCGIAGSAEFQERDVGETWVTRTIGAGDLFVTRSKVPHEVRFSPAASFMTCSPNLRADRDNPAPCPLRVGLAQRLR